MVLHKILKKEKKNLYKIYLYINVENCLCYSYDFSAYLLTQLLNIKLEETKMNSGVTVFYAQLSLQSVIDRLSGPNTMVDDDLITIVLDDPVRCFQWKLEFDNFKSGQNKFYNKFMVNLRSFFYK